MGDAAPVKTDPSAGSIEERFRALMIRRAGPLLRLAMHLARREDPSATRDITRPLLGEVLSQASQIEELLDAYGARNNSRWHGFRSVAAAFKLFADLGYELLHIRHAAESYHLLPIEEDFRAATDRAVSFTAVVLTRTARRALERAGALGLPLSEEPAAGERYEEHLPPGRLAHDLGTRSTHTAEETVTHLATAFLNLAAESEMLHMAARAKSDIYPSLVPEPVNEEALRTLQDRFQIGRAHV
mgnify:FL=1